MAEDYSALAEKQVRMEEQIKTLFKQQAEIKSLTETVHKLATSVELMAQTQKDTTKKVDDLTSDVESIKEKPGKRWDNASTVVITAIITAVVTFILTKLGLK